MFIHYLKIAIRNIRKFALQNTVSVIGLAAGFVCLSLSSVWLYYENSFDRFHKDADRMFTHCASLQQGSLEHMIATGNVAIKSYSEKMGATETTYFRFNENTEEYKEIMVDSAFCTFFDIKMLKGDWSFIGDRNAVALSAEYAERLFRNQDPLGQSIGNREIRAVVNGFRKPSVLKFDVMSFRPVEYNVDVNSINSYAEMDTRIQSNFFMKLPKGVSVEGALNSANASNDSIVSLNRSLNKALGVSSEFEPIIGLHERMIRDGSYVSYRVMYLFCMASAMLMLCSIINILIFFINIIRIRERESRLRVAHGATVSNLLGMFTIEISVLVLIGLFLGLIMVWVLKEAFIGLTDVSMHSGFLIKSCLMEALVVFVVSVLFCMGVIKALKITSPDSTLMSTGNGNRFRKFSVGLQMFAGAFFIFVTCVMLKQFHFLRNQNWGFKVKDQAVVSMTPAGLKTLGELHLDDEEEIQRWSEMMNIDLQKKLEEQYALTGKLESLPMVTEVLAGTGDMFSNTFGRLVNEEGKLNGIDSISYKVVDMLDMQGLKVLDLIVTDGTIPLDRPIMENEIVISENLSKLLGLGPVSEEPVISIESTFISFFGGLGFNTETNDYHVIAVVKDVNFYKYDGEPDRLILCTPQHPKLASASGMFSAMSASEAYFMIRYQNGFKKELKQQLEDMFEGMDINYSIYFTEDRYFESLEKERHLTNLILGLGVVCMIISVFGIWSMMSLACQERRREIAVRKVHGARVRDILSIFARDYGQMLLASVLLSFVTGFLFMHRWLQQFPRQTVISWWIYAGILVTMALVICLTVGNKVLKTASENPADVIKSE